MGFISLFIHFYFVFIPFHFVFIPFQGAEKRFVPGGDEGRSSWLLGLSSHHQPLSRPALLLPYYLLHYLLYYHFLSYLLSFSILFTTLLLFNIAILLKGQQNKAPPPPIHSTHKARAARLFASN